jgi:streptogramin lyase
MKPLKILLLLGLTFAAQAEDNPFTRPPTVMEADLEKLPQAELLGTPSVRTLVGYTRRILHLYDGVTLAFFSYSGSAPANWIFLLDSRDLSFERYSIPNNDIASHSAALGTDGNIYIMPYSTGRAYKFDVIKKTFSEIEVDLPDGEYTWDAIGASNGRIYFGTYPHAYLGEYDPIADKFDLRRQVVPEKKYTISFSEDPDGKIRFKAWGPGEDWLLFDAETRELASAPKSEAPPPAPAAPTDQPKVEEPDVPEGDTDFRNRLQVEGRRFALSFPTSRLWEIAEDGSLTLRGDPNAPAEVWFLEQIPGAIIGISHYGFTFRYDLAAGEFKRSQIDNLAPGGNGVMFIEALSPDAVIGANYSQQNLFKIDPNTGKIDSSEGMIARVTGEPMCAIGFNGFGYIGIYVSSLISKYDPNRPFLFGENPRELIELGEKYSQTRPRDTATDGRLVFMSSDSAYDRLGGALCVIDPETDKIDVYHQPIEDQNLPTLAYDPKTKLLWGGTDRWGQMRSRPPTRESSLIYAFDIADRRVVTTLTLWPGADVTDVKGVLPGGILVASASGEVAFVDTESRQILYRGPAGFALPKRINIGMDGNAYFLSSGILYRWEPVENVLNPVASALGCSMLTQASEKTWIAADNISVYRVTLP